jgi:ribosome-associated protein
LNDQKLFETILRALDEKKAKALKAVDISQLTTIAHYFVICSGTSVTHIKSLADNVEEKLQEQDIRPIHKEGYNSARWILLDYSDVVVHIFHEEDREFYGLERLWQDGRQVDLESSLAGSLA